MELNNGQKLLRGRCLRILCSHYPTAPLFGIMQCCDEWVLNGNAIPTGVVQYFKTYYLN